MILQTVLEKHIMDPKNPELCYDLAKEYGESHAAEVQDWWMKLRKVY